MCARSIVTDNQQTLTVVQNLESKLKLKKQRRKAMEQYQADHQKSEAKMNDDLLALSTEYTQKVMSAFNYQLARCKDTKAFRILFCTTQPAHLVTIFAVMAVATLLSPCEVKSFSLSSKSTKNSPWISLIYLGAYMMHFGAQMWMTFVSGLTLYFTVPRHTFGEVQKVLFPKYFGINSCLSFVTLIVFVKLNPSSLWDSYLTFQVYVMVVCFLVELVIRLYLAPPLLKLIVAKIAIEKAAGVGMEVGKHDPGPLAQCPHYVSLHRTFRRIHMTIAVGNIISMACTMIHLHYLASKI